MMKKTVPEKAIISLVKDFYVTIDAQQWDIQRTLVSDNFIALLGSSIQIPLSSWQDKLKGFYKGFPDGKHQLDFYVVEGNRILSVGSFSGSHQNKFMGNSATGNQIKMGVMHLDRVIDNKIVEHIAVADLLGLINQLSQKKE
jgi:predicted ester cyclase